MSSKELQAAIEKINLLDGLKRSQMSGTIVEEAVKLTGSSIGYFATMNEDESVLTMLGWSYSAMGACSMIDKPIVYPIEKTGLWGDAVRERRAVVTNDYKGLVKPTKKGYPEGHVAVQRHMNVPLFEGQKIRGVLGVGNKGADYSAQDAEELQAFADAVWKVVGPATP